VSGLLQHEHQTDVGNGLMDRNLDIIPVRSKTDADVMDGVSEFRKDKEDGIA